jgi:hypothetical protein
MPLTFHKSRFCWSQHPSAYIGVGDISDLGPNPLQQILPDALDEGFVLAGNREEIPMVVHKTERVGDEVVAWHLKPVKKGLKVNGLRLVIVLFND